MCQVAWKFGKTSRELQTGVIISIFKKGDRKQCTYYREISLLSLPGKLYVKCLKRKCREIVKPKLQDGQCGFLAGRSTTDQIFTLKQIFEKSWEYGKDLFACFVNLEKACDRVPRDKLWKVLQEYGVDVVVVAYIYPPITRQRQMLTCWTIRTLFITKTTSRLEGSAPA